MKNTRAALRYAKAVLSISLEEKTETEIGKDMQTIRETFAENNELSVFLENPVIPNATKQESIAKIFPALKNTTKQLIDLLARNSRINLLGQVAEAYTSLLEKHQGKETAVVTTAVPLSSALEKIVLAKAKELSKAEISLTNNVDPSIVGGFILRIGDLQYNASVSNQLEHLKRELTQKNYSA